ncbi:MAG: CDC48 family AAA ATPase [Candidatus Aenigmatarchaeota archaeon]
MAEKDISLRVGELTDRSESGMSMVRLESKMMTELGIREGDVIELQGKKKTGAIAVRAYPADIGLGLVRMDGITRTNIGVGVGETVKIAKADVKEAKKVVIAPAQKDEVLEISQGVADLLRQNLMGRPLMKGDVISPSPASRGRPRQQQSFGNDDMDPFFDIFRSMGINIQGGDFTPFIPMQSETRLAIVATQPEGSIVKIAPTTQIELRKEAVDIDAAGRVPTITYEDIGGLHDMLVKIREMVELPLRHPELFVRLGIDPPKGVLLYGPPGTGKTLLAKAVANESGANFYSIAGPEIMSKWYGQTEENLRKLFEEAQKNAPSIVFIDEIDAIAPKREDVTGEVEKRTVSQLLALMDGLKARGKVIVIAATNMPNSLDPALRRPGRFDREIEIGVPDTRGRKEILQIHTRNMPLEPDVDLDFLAGRTYGFVGADLEALAKEAAMSALKRLLPQITWRKEEEIPQDVLKKLKVGKKDFDNGLKMVEPSGMREVMIEIPNVKWNDIGGLEGVKQSLKEIIEWPLKNPEVFTNIGVSPPKGILLYGPPGTGKTLLAKAVASESGANFISVRGPEVLSKWVGESEKHIREIFKRAKQVAPSIIFFDEMDALVPRRGTDMGTRVAENVVSQILTHMSGVEEMHNVVVIGATNRPDILDPALLRPGRFDRQVLVPAPDEKSRLEVLKIHTKKMKMKDVDLKKFAKLTDGYSGADLEALVREAGINAIREIMAKEKPVETAVKTAKTKKAKTEKPADNKEEYFVTKKHFDEALKNSRPSITPDMLRYYEKIIESFRSRGMEMKKGSKKEDTDYLE